MKFMDEMRGSEGERCIVTDLRVGERFPGTIVSIDEDTGKVIVDDDARGRYAVGFGFVELVLTEDEANDRA